MERVFKQLTEGGLMGISERRYHRERLKKKRQNYWGFNSQHRGAATIRQLGILVNTPKPCSCWMCRNRRKDEGETIQERKYGRQNIDT